MTCLPPNTVAPPNMPCDICSDASDVCVNVDDVIAVVTFCVRCVIDCEIDEILGA